MPKSIVRTVSSLDGGGGTSSVKPHRLNIVRPVPHDAHPRSFSRGRDTKDQERSSPVARWARCGDAVQDRTTGGHDESMQNIFFMPSDDACYRARSEPAC